MTLSQRSEGKYRKTVPDKTPIIVPANPHGVSEIAFTSDRKGDLDNVRYGSLDKRKIPRYHTAGHGRLLGLDRRFRLVSISDTKRQVEDETNDVTRVNRSSSLLGARLSGSDEPIQLSTSSYDDQSFEEQNDFVSFESQRGRKRRRISPDNAATKHRNSLIFQDRTEDSSSPSADEQLDDRATHLGHTADQDAFETFRNHPDNQKQIELTRITDSDPQNVAAWLKLIEHQERYLRLSTPEDNRRLGAVERQSVADLRISLYERALSKVRDSAARDQLALGLMREGSTYWDTNKQLTEWKAALKQTSSFSLLYPFLKFYQSNPIVFSYDKALKVHLDALQRAQRLLPEEDCDWHSINILLKLTSFMDHCGFTERAVAIWQALLELNFRRRSATTEGETIKSFEEFWNAETARIGEEGTGIKPTEAYQPPAITDSTPRPFRKLHVFEDWSEEEHERSKRDVLPARTLDETLEDDPYRVIVWIDIKEFMVIVRTDYGREMLLQAYLKFTNLPPLFRNDSDHLQWRQDAFLSCGPPKVHVDSQDTAVNTPDEPNLQFVLPDTSVLFARTEPWDGIWKSVAATSPAIVQLAIRALSVLVELAPGDDHLAEYTVALQYHINPAQAAKYVKRLLKKRPGCLRLYNAHALMEARNGRLDVASNVWSISLSMLSHRDAGSEESTVLLWHSWVWELLRVRRWNSVLHMILHALSSDTVQQYKSVNDDYANDFSEMQILTARSYLDSVLTKALRTRKAQAAAMYTDLTAVLLYLLNDHNLDEAVQAYHLVLASLDRSRDDIIIELIHQHRTTLLHFHSQFSPSGFRPGQLVSLLQESCLLFPENSLFHSLHEHFSRRAGMVDRLRRLDANIQQQQSNESFQSQSANNEPRKQIQSIILTLLNLSSTLSRPAYAGSTTHLIRSSFQAATSSPNPARHNPHLWLSWITWEISLLQPSFEDKHIPQNRPSSHSQNNSRSTPAVTSAQSSKHLKTTLLSSLNACPWFKDLYMQAFLHPAMRESLGRKALTDIYKTMLERGLRVRIDIEDVIGDEEGESNTGSEVNDE